MVLSVFKSGSFFFFQKLFLKIKSLLLSGAHRGEQETFQLFLLSKNIQGPSWAISIIQILTRELGPLEITSPSSVFSQGDPQPKQIFHLIRKRSWSLTKCISSRTGTSYILIGESINKTELTFPELPHFVNQGIIFIKGIAFIKGDSLLFRTFTSVPPLNKASDLSFGSRLLSFIQVLMETLPSAPTVIASYGRRHLWI